MSGKFCSAIRRDGFYGKSLEGANYDAADLACVLLVRLTAGNKAALSVNERNEAGSACFSCNGVAFPIPKPSPIICCTRTGRKFVADTDFSATLHISFLMTRFALVPQLSHCTACPVGQLLIVEQTCIDSSVDSSVADGLTMLFQTPCDFFRRPLVLNEFVFYDCAQVDAVQLFMGTAFLAPLTVVLLRQCRDIVFP